MKEIDRSLINRSAKTTSANREEACPTCGGAAWGFENGLVYCADHGHFEPEPADVRLYAMQVRFNRQHGLVFPLANFEPEAQEPLGDDGFASRHRPVLTVYDLPGRPPAQDDHPLTRGHTVLVDHVVDRYQLDRVAFVPGAAPAATAITMTGERVDGAIQGAYEMGSRARS